MSYLIYDIKFYKVDEHGEEVKDAKGNTKLFEPKGRWKDLEYLCEDRDDDDFKEITNDDDSIIEDYTNDFVSKFKPKPCAVGPVDLPTCTF